MTVKLLPFPLRIFLFFREMSEQFKENNDNLDKTFIGINDNCDKINEKFNKMNDKFDETSDKLDKYHNK